MCVIAVTAELDAGPIHGCARFAVGPEDDAGRVRARALELGAPLLAEALRGPTHGKEQPADGVTYATRSSLETGGSTGPGRPSSGQPHPGALAAHRARHELDGQPVTVWRARAGPGRGIRARSPRRCRSACGEGVLEVVELQPAGRGGWRSPTTCAGSGDAPERAA